MRKRVVVLVVVVLAILGGVVLSAWPAPSGAWPWQHPKSVHLTGEVTCKDFDVSGESRFPFARVEGFEIRGRSGVLLGDDGSGYAASYATDVPLGWKVQYSVKCSSDHQWHDSSAAESFTISDSTVGDSATQKRNICYGGGIFEPCQPRRLGACVTYLITRQIQTALTLEKAVAVLYNKFGTNQGTLPQQCEAAIKEALPELNQQPAPTTDPTATKLPMPPAATKAPLPTVAVPQPSTTQAPDAKDPASSSGQTTQAPKPSTTQASEPSQVPSLNGKVVTVYNQVTDGDSMREDKPAYLSDARQNFCRQTGCMLPGTEMSSGTQVIAVCRQSGDRTTNGQDDNQNDDNNPDLFESTRWYSIRWSDGRLGYLSEVWVDPADRGGLDLPTC